MTAAAATAVDDLADIPAGPDLCAALHALPLSRVPNDRILEWTRAQYRQSNHEQARVAATLYELARCDAATPGEVSRRGGASEFAAHESRAALRWTHTCAEYEHALAEFVIGRAPLVFAAWWAGTIDRARVRVFEQYLFGLDPAQLAAVCATAVPQAPDLTTGQLTALLKRLVIGVDPEAAARWYRRRVRERGVCAYLAPDGTVTMTAYGLPADQAQAACERVGHLADAARRAGHPGLIGQIRADVHLGLLDGRLDGLDTDQIIATLIADHHAAEAEAEAAAAKEAAASAAAAEQTTGRKGNRSPRFDFLTRLGRCTTPGRDSQDTDDSDGNPLEEVTGDHDEPGKPNADGDSGGSPDQNAGDIDGVDGHVDDDPHDDGGPAGPDDGGPGGPDDDGGPGGPGDPAPGGPDGGSESSSLDECDHPDDDGSSDSPVGGGATVDRPDRVEAPDPGAGSDTPADSGDTAVAAVAAEADAAVVPEGIGDDVADGPAGIDGSGDSARSPGPRALPGDRRNPADQRRGIEIRVALSTMLGLDEHPGEIPGLGPVPAHVARARALLQTRAEWRFAVTSTDGTRLLSEGRTARRPSGTTRAGPPGGIVELQISDDLLAELAVDPARASRWATIVADIAGRHAHREAHLADLDAHPEARLPSVGQRRHTEIRDRTCTFAGVCRRPAHHSHQDHCLDHALGGATVISNLGPVCAMDHVVKHGAGWTTEPSPDGGVHWHSPLGGHYRSRAEFLTSPMPEQVPRPEFHTDPDDPLTDLLEGTVLEPPPTPPRSRQPPRPRPDLPDDPPF